MLDIIKEKIKNGEGYIEIETLGIIKASEYRQLTDPQWDKTISDYKDQIDFLNNEFNISKESIEIDINNLKNEIYNIKLELESENLILLYDKLKTEEKRFNLYHSDMKIVSKEEKKFQNDPIIRNLENQVNEIKNTIFMKIKIKENEIDKKRLDIQNLERNLRNRLIKISNTLQLERKAQNPDYLNNQKLKVIKIFTKYDYKIENDELILLSNEEKLEKEKEKRKKSIAKELQQLYPEKVIDGTLQVIYNEKCQEIDILSTIQEIKNYKIGDI